MSVATVEESTESVTASDFVLGLWQCCAQPAGSITHPDQLEASGDWLQAAVPGTVASALASEGRWDFDHPVDIDSSDWWYCTSFTASADDGHPCWLRLDGLATLAEVWLNGQLLLTADNMFRGYRIDVSSRLQAENRLVVGFRSMTQDLKWKRPRPRWKTNLVNNQQLRWQRTSLQGRIPGWSPPAPAIGPWRDVALETGPFVLQDLRLNTRLEGDTGVVTVAARIACRSPIQRVFLRAGTVLTLLEHRLVDGVVTVSGEVHVPKAKRWWPHTHGRPSLYECELVLESGGEQHLLECPSVGFRSLEVVTDPGYQIRINGESIYCRGACWTVGDILNLTGSKESLRHDLTLARDAGVNMLRVGGTMVYESDDFYRLCDELGILVWQDFMFANMDYPVDDESFRQNIEIEATQQLTRLAPHPCVAIYCGNSEVEQQAAMLGMPRELWSNSWFTEQLPALCTRLHPAAGYVPSTPTGGALPFHPDRGLTHYYGVGAYLRPQTDVRRTDVKFTPETLGFSNVPGTSTIEMVTGGNHPAMHDPRWKRRVPRDTGAGWDFEDVRDHYLRELFEVDPVRLRSSDTNRYLQLSRHVPGEMMHQVFSEWRCTHSRNNGGLVWFYKDLWPGAGWGIVDSTGMPKATYYYLKRTWSPRQLVLTDEGLNGLHAHLVNESLEPCQGTVEITLLKEPNVVVARQQVVAALDARSRKMFSADEILGAFYDVSYAYRFGPPHHDIVMATWYDSNRQIISEAYHFIQRSQALRPATATLNVSVERFGDFEYCVSLECDRFLHGVQLTAKGFLPDDNYFHLPPQRQKCIRFGARSNAACTFKATVEALNLEGSQVCSLRATAT